MSLDPPGIGMPAFPPRTGQVVLEPAEAELEPTDQVRALYRLSDPALSELGLEDLLGELLVRVQEALAVDTVAILLHDAEANQLVARAAKGIEEEVEQGVRIPIGRGFAGRIAAERVAIFIADVHHADIMNPILRQKGIRSLLGVPLIVEGDLIGVLHVGSLKPRQFEPRDVAVLQMAAARAAPGIERARLFSALEYEHRAAMILQRSLLPKQLVKGPAISAAARYLPASHEVGGDWYDVFPLPRGRFGIVIGDVVGHGLPAAALMGQLQTAVHCYAMLDHSPAATLELVDRFVQTLTGPAMATAAYAILEPDTGDLTLSSAGHLPPLIVGGETPRLLGVAAAPPLGAFPYASWDEQQAKLEEGETLVLYTDGLVERPRVPLMENIGRLLEVTARAATAEDVCRAAVENLIPPGRLRDDIAIVALTYGNVPSELRMRLDANPKVLAEMRRDLRRWLKSQQVADRDSREIVLAVNEACANAIEHAYAPAPEDFELGAARNGDMVTVTVSDRGTWRSPRGQNRGRGLGIVEAAMDQVNIDTTERGTVVTMQRRLQR